MKYRILPIVLSLFCYTFLSSAQQVLYGTNSYVEYQAGTLPFIISVPHGGSLEPPSIPDRTCNNPVYTKDLYTIETALEIKYHLFTTTGCYPHIIISHLRRNKLDPNRNLAEGACGDPEAETAWNEFHNFIAEARNSANQQYNHQTFFVDLHGHGHPVQRIELGYMLSDEELESEDTILNSTQFINSSSIRNLALNNFHGYTHAQLLRGPKAFGTLLTNQNFPSVPSESIPFPGTDAAYFSGGYITANHTCYTSGINMNGLQMELNYTGVRNTPEARTEFAHAFTEAMIEYMNSHFNMSWNSCNPLSTEDVSLSTWPVFYPNPVKKGEMIYFNFIDDAGYDYRIFNMMGQQSTIGQLWTGGNTIDTEKLSTGIYILQISERQSSKIAFKKLIIQ